MNFYAAEHSSHQQLLPFCAFLNGLVVGAKSFLIFQTTMLLVARKSAQLKLLTRLKFPKQCYWP